MQKYQILKLNDNAFDFLVIATSYENPLNDIEEISKEIAVNKANILFDLTLINGIKDNRYISCVFNKEENNSTTYSLVKGINENIRFISRNFFIKNKEVVQKSVIPDSLKFILAEGMM